MLAGQTHIGQEIRQRVDHPLIPHLREVLLLDSSAIEVSEKVLIVVAVIEIVLLHRQSDGAKVFMQSVSYSARSEFDLVESVLWSSEADYEDSIAFASMQFIPIYLKNFTALQL
jgi:hypothetical protein